MRHGRESGFTLLETLVAVSVFAVGALGALSLVFDITSLNANADQMHQAGQVANWFLEQVEVRAPGDPAIINDTANDVWVGGNYGGGALGTQQSSASTVGIPDIQTNTTSGAASVRYQMVWKSDLNTGAGAGVRHWRVRVAWPRSRDARVLRDTDGTAFVNCFPSAGVVDRANCSMVEFHTYRKL